MLSQRVCERLNWKSGSGDWQTGGARKALVHLHRAGALRLPDVSQTVTPRKAACLDLDLPHIEANLSQLGPIELIQVTTRSQAQVYRFLMTRHPLGDKPLCGASVRYVTRCPLGYLGAAAFQSASFALKDRDTHIGWGETTRRAKLHRVIANARFLILPFVKVPNLASHLLGQLVKRVPDNWQTRHGIRPVLIETFVHPDHDGACYRAANWGEIGWSAGRRDGIKKRVLLYYLADDWKRQLYHAKAVTPARRPAQGWAEEEFGAVRLWDERLKRRLYHLAQGFCERAEANLTERAHTWKDAIASYRFMKNPQINMLLAAHREAVIDRIRLHPVVLVPQDTTYLNYSAQQATQGLGPIGTKADGPTGLVLHNAHAFTPQGSPLGVVGADCWSRDPEMHGKRRPKDERESQKWIDSYQWLDEIQKRCPRTMLVSVCDREGDFFDLLDTARSPDGAKLLVRAYRSRHHKTRAEDSDTALWETVARMPLAGEVKLALPRRGSRLARDVMLDVRFGKVVIEAPKTRQGVPGSLWAVHLLETAKPQEGTEDEAVIEWMLLTTVPTTTFEEAVTRSQWYATRWGIEVFHRTRGCRIEHRQLGSATRLENCLAIDMVVAWRINYLTLLARTNPDAPCTVFFEDSEWKALSILHHETADVPATPPTLRIAVRWLAKLGGFLGRKGDGEPGPTVIWRGLQHLHVGTAMYLHMTHKPQPQNWMEFPLATSANIRSPLVSHRDVRSHVCIKLSFHNGEGQWESNPL